MYLKCFHLQYLLISFQNSYCLWTWSSCSWNSYWKLEKV